MAMLTNRKKKNSTNRKTTITKDTNNNSKKQQKEEKKNKLRQITNTNSATPKSVHGNQGHPAHQNIDKY